MSHLRALRAADATHIQLGDASQDTRHKPKKVYKATTIRAGETHIIRKENPAEWRSIKEELISIKEGLEKEEGLNLRFV